MQVISGGRRGRRAKPVPLAPLDPIESAKAAGLRYIAHQGPGIERRQTKSGFEYAKADGSVVQDQATLERIASLVIPPAWTNVWICPSPNGHLQAIGRDAKGRKQYRYHPAYRSVRDQNKYGRMLRFAAALPRIRHQVAEDLKLPGLPKRKVVAAVVRLLESTAMRIGNEEYAKENEHYGLTTLHDEHVRIHGGHLRFRFVGKSGQHQDIELDDKNLAKIVKQCQDIPGHELFQYYDEHHDAHKIDSADVNEYLREVSGEEFTAKDFRTWEGTGHTALALHRLGRAETATTAKKNIIAAVKEAAEKLGNKPATCRNYYIHPAVLDSYVDHRLFTVMETVAEMVQEGMGLSPVEQCLVVLVEQHISAPGGGALAQFFGRKKAS